MYVNKTRLVEDTILRDAFFKKYPCFTLLTRKRKSKFTSRDEYNIPEYDHLAWMTHNKTTEETVGAGTGLMRNLSN